MVVLGVINMPTLFIFGCIFSVHASALAAEMQACGGEGDPTCEAMGVVAKLADMSGDEFGVQLVQKTSMAKSLQGLRKSPLGAERLPGLKAGGRWLLGKEKQSCTQACSSISSSCKPQDFAMAARAAAGAPEAVLGAVAKEEELSCKDYSSAYGASPDIPARWSSGTCAKGSAVRRDDSVKCGQAPGGTTRRFCFCGSYIPPTLATGTGGTWMLGDVQQSCTDACASIRSSCKQKAYAEAARVAAGAPETIFGALGAKANLACKKYSGAYGNAADIPARWNSGECAKGSESRSDDSVKCEQKPSGETRRFCYCGSYNTLKPSPAPTPAVQPAVKPGGRWLLGKEKQSCTQACSSISSSCKPQDFAMAARAAAGAPEAVLGAVAKEEELSCKDYSSAYGASPDIPARWSSGTCAKGSAVRRDDSVKCGQAPGGTTRRFCFCGSYIPPTLATGTGGTWMLGDVQQSCTDACASIQSSCKQKAYAEAARVAAGAPETIFGALGAKANLACKKYSGAYGNAADIPARWNSGECAKGSESRSDDSVKCEKKPSGETRRFCYCGSYSTLKPTPAPTPAVKPTASFQNYEWFHADCSGGSIKEVKGDDPAAQKQCNANAACVGWSVNYGTNVRRLRSVDCKAIATGKWIYFKKIVS